MPLIECPECGKKISDKAINCPNCGYPINVSNKEIINISNYHNDDNTPSTSGCFEFIPLLLKSIIQVVVYGVLLWFCLSVLFS